MVVRRVYGIAVPARSRSRLSVATVGPVEANDLRAAAGLTHGKEGVDGSSPSEGLAQRSQL
jgi:hypothetical protein